MFQIIIQFKVLMKKKYLEIKEGKLEVAFKVAEQIPEFEKLYSKSDFESRLINIKNLIIIAYYNNMPIGFKIGYETPSKKYFYSWMGGVLSKYRKSGVAQLLMNYQEDWAKQNNYERVLVKTRKKHLAMVKFLEKNNYYEMGVLTYDPISETRILYEKQL